MDDPHNAEAADATPEARFGAELRRLRVQGGLSVRRLADELSRAHSGIVEYESGRRLPGADVVEQYEDYFGLSRGTLGAQRERARAQRLDTPRDATVAEQLGDIACPYKGLCAFESDDAALFFGRETQVQRVLARIAEARFVAVVGASGSGKSSFLRAGLLAGIKAAASNGAAGARVALLTPGERPVDELACAVGAASGGAARLLADELRDDPAALERATRRGGGLVIAVDQFEELFTLCADEAERRCFVDALLAAWRDPASPVLVMLALRADFYGRVASFPELAAAVVAHQTLIGPMGAVDLRRVIELPAASTGLVLQPGLVETMLEDLAGEPGALPLLSHALLETCKRRRRLMLTVAGYREAGGVRGAIAQTAERTLQTLPEDGRAIARSIFLSLTDLGEGAEPTSRRVERGELVAHHRSGQSLDGVLGILADARLISVDEDTVAVAHEALIRHWPRLRGWIEADRAGLLIHRRLADAAREWDALEREPAALYRGARLAAAADWAIDHPDHVSGLERDFLTASRAIEHRRTRRLRVLATGLAALTAIVAALAVWALDQRGDAQRQRGEAQHQTAEATSLALASSALPLLSSRPDVSLLLALEAYRESPRAEARSSVLTARAAARDPGILAIMRGHGAVVDSVAFSPDGRTLATAGADHSVRLWDARTHRQLGRPLAGHSEDVRSVAFSGDGRTLASAGDDDTIRLWDARTHRQLGRPLTGHSRFVFSVAFSGDGRRLASASADHTIRLWDVRTHEQVGRPLTGHTDWVVSVAFGRDGRRLASAGWDGTIRLWDVRRHEQVGRPLTGHTGRVVSVAFDGDGRRLASAGWDGTIRLWDVRRHGSVGRPLTGHTGRVVSVAFSGDGHKLASTSADTTIRLWDVGSQERAGKPLTGHVENVVSVAVSRDGATLASASVDKTIRLWDVRTRSPIGPPLTGHTNVVFGVAFSPDGRRLASAGADKTIRLWDVRTRKQIGPPLSGHANLVVGVAFSPDGRRLASASADRTIRLWDVRTRSPIGRPLSGHSEPVFGVAFSPDGRRLASASADHTIRLWDMRTRTRVGQPLVGHTDLVAGVAFSPDGRTLASAGADKTIRLWDARSRKQIGRPLIGHTERIDSVAFGPDGRTLASASWDKTVRLWERVLWRSFAELQADVCKLVGSGLSTTEWAHYATGIPYRQSCP